MSIIGNCPICHKIRGFHQSILPGCICNFTYPASRFLGWQKSINWGGNIPPEPSEHKQLSERTIWTLFERCGLSAYHVKDSQMEYNFDRCLVDFVRAIEQEHGIIGRDE